MNQIHSLSMTQQIPGYGLNLEEKMLTLLLITPDTNRNKDVCPLHQLFITLRFYARGALLVEAILKLNRQISMSQYKFARIFTVW